ncbi:hypothetical protein EJ04DRAFT_508004 [Polyplosphaeria fusca]|uniref:Coenzyme Q-binding protein COQ10 START domain-containing protein n=1 Tax=Polyplosphaeria fusca TaxID=682080 RepID=A0A9P4RCE0_9PLEO|nr:hypothetical protein EJ04DRAFT_508004 [Polyplosphaeria fusca]
MATKTLRPHLLRPLHATPRTPKRTFLPNPFAAPTTPFTPQVQTLTARRMLPYPPFPIYAIIVDIGSYSAFLPPCTSSTVTKWSQPDAVYHRRWPSEGTMTVGWKGLNEVFASRIFCVPGRIVESVGGATETALRGDEIRHHLDAAEGGRAGGDGDGGADLLTHLRSRWTLSPLPSERSDGPAQTEVVLSLEFAFANPFYTFMSAAAKPVVAERMIEAFEGRLRSQLDGRTDLEQAKLADFGGSLPA